MTRRLRLTALSRAIDGIRLAALYIWWLLCGFGRWLWQADRTLPCFGWVLYWDSGRHTSWRLTHCLSCTWKGPLRWAVHTYQLAGDNDVEPVDLCPKCKGEVF